ncbi:unnamed protein product [marine sediment metagenome]|uniref:Uncharacterized protein n=1 Tax=marine sediment metagenome TaxID=412755 RepID=X1QLU7_9ZZZZ
MERDSDINKLVWPEDARKFQWIDRAKAIMEFATRAGTAFLGYQAFEKAVPGSGLAGAIVSQVALRLASANNIVSGGAGVATLASMGIINVWPSGPVTFDPVAAGQSWMDQLGAYLREIGFLPPLREEFL